MMDFVCSNEMRKFRYANLEDGNLLLIGWIRSELDVMRRTAKAMNKNQKKSRKCKSQATDHRRKGQSHKPHAKQNPN